MIFTGLALLINIDTYENDVQEQRVGSDIDVENLSELLKGLEFDVAVHRNLHLAAFFKVSLIVVKVQTNHLMMFISGDHRVLLQQDAQRGRHGNSGHSKVRN